MQLTSSGEVAQFIDDDQFASGQSQDKCGPEAVSMFWHSVAPDQANPYTAADVHAMASADYQKFIGPDVASDQAGTSNQTLYDMLAYHQFQYEILPLDAATIRAQLSSGKPVIVGITESSVYDRQINGNPYNWPTAGLSHIIILSGYKGADWLCRDTASIDPTSGIVRPGPRLYDANRLALISATAVTPSWWQPPVTIPDPQILAAWGHSVPYLPTFGIESAYARAYEKGVYLGECLEGERPGPDGWTYQNFTASQARYEQATGQTSWLTSNGSVVF